MAILTASALTAAMFLQKDLFADSAKKADYIAETNAANALIENTTAKIENVIGNSDKKLKVKIYFSDFCAPAPGTIEPDFCTITGDESNSDAIEYEIDTHVTGTFTIDEAQYENNMLNISEVFADQMLKTKKSLDEKISAVLISKLGTMTSDNLYTTGGIGCPADPLPLDWSTTFIAPHLWTPELMRYFQTVSRINKFSSPFLLDGKNLDSTIWKAMMNAGNATGAGAANMVKLMKYYEDLVNMEAVAPGKTYMIERGSVAFASRSRWTKNSAANPIIEAEISRKKYSEKSENLMGVSYDVYITTECSGPYKKHNVLVHGMYGLYNGATNCNDGTGVLEFECGACPA